MLLNQKTEYIKYKKFKAELVDTKESKTSILYTFKVYRIEGSIIGTDILKYHYTQRLMYTKKEADFSYGAASRWMLDILKYINKHHRIL